MLMIGRRRRDDVPAERTAEGAAGAAAWAEAEAHRIEVTKSAELRARDAERQAERRERQAERLEQDRRRRDRAARRAELWGRVSTVGLRRVVLIVPLLAVNGMALAGQVGFAQAHLGWHAPMSWVFAGALESIAIYIGWHAHEALLSGHSVVKLRAASYGAAAVVGGMNYEHFTPKGWTHPTTQGVAFGLMSVISPWLWAMHSRHAHRERLEAEGMIDRRGARFGAAKWAHFPVRTLRALRWSIDHGVSDPAGAWAGYAAERAARRNAQPEGERNGRRWLRKASGTDQASGRLDAQTSGSGGTASATEGELSARALPARLVLPEGVPPLFVALPRTAEVARAVPALAGPLGAGIPALLPAETSEVRPVPPTTFRSNSADDEGVSGGDAETSGSLDAQTSGPSGTPEADTQRPPEGLPLPSGTAASTSGGDTETSGSLDVQTSESGGTDAAPQGDRSAGAGTVPPVPDETEVQELARRVRENAQRKEALRRAYDARAELARLGADVPGLVGSPETWLDYLSDGEQCKAEARRIWCEVRAASGFEVSGTLLAAAFGRLEAWGDVQAREAASDETAAARAELAHLGVEPMVAWSTVDDLGPDDLRSEARRMWRESREHAEGGVSGSVIGHAFRRSDRWGRMQIEEARREDGQVIELAGRITGGGTES